MPLATLVGGGIMNSNIEKKDKEINDQCKSKEKNKYSHKDDGLGGRVAVGQTCGCLTQKTDEGRANMFTCVLVGTLWPRFVKVCFASSKRNSNISKTTKGSRPPSLSNVLVYPLPLSSLKFSILSPS